MIRKLTARLSPDLSIFGLVTSVSLLLTGGHSTSIDEETYLASLRAFLHGRSALDMSAVTQSSIVAMPGKTGTLTSFYGFGTTLFNLPLYTVGKLFSSLADSANKELVLRTFLYSTNSFALAITAVIIYRICRMLGTSSTMSIWAALTFGVCTYALPMAGGGFAEPLTAMFLVLAIHSALRADPRTHTLMCCGLFLGCAILMRSSAFIFVPFIALHMVVVAKRGDRFRRLKWCVAGGATPVAIFLFINWWKFGNVLKTGYPSMTYDTPLYEGLYGQFLSAGKGLLWFAPIILVAVLTMGTVLKSHRSTSLLLWACIAANAVLFGRFQIWSGDDAFGPRYMTVVLPLIAVLAGLGASSLPSWSRRAVSLLGLVPSLGGALVYFNAANFSRIDELVSILGPSSRNADGTLNSETIRQALWFRPRLSQLTYHFTHIDDAIRGTWTSARGANTPNIFVHGNGPALGWYSKSIRLDMWWTYLLETNAPRLLLLSVPLLVAAILLFAYALWQSRTTSDRQPIT